MVKEGKPRNLTPNPFAMREGEPDLRIHTLGSGFEVDALPRVVSFRQKLFLLGGSTGTAAHSTSGWGWRGGGSLTVVHYIYVASRIGVGQAKKFIPNAAEALRTSKKIRRRG